MKAKAILECLRVEILLVHRRLWVYPLFFLMLAYYAYGANDRVQIPGQIVNYTAYQVQVGIFLFLLCGVLVSREEAVTDSEEVYQTIRGGLLAKSTAKLLLLLLASFLFTLCAYGITLFLYVQHDIPSSFDLPSLQYLVLYWFIPFVITGTLGLALGLLIRSKWVFPLGMLLGLLMGPLNSITYVSVTKSLPTFLEQTMLMMNLGQSDPFRVYHLVYGFQMEGFRWVTKAALLLDAVVLLAVALLVRLKSVRKWQLGIGTLAVLVLVNWFSWQIFAPYVPTLSSRTALREDNHYYHDQPKQELAQAQRFDITRYEMNLKLEAGVVNDVKMKVTSAEQLKTLVFSLYHDLLVNEVSLDGAEVSFKQDRDLLVIELPQPKSPNQAFDLRIQYAGSTPLRFFASREAVMLPNFVAWYPIAGAHTVADYDNMTRYYPVYPKNSPQFVLHYQGPTPLYTNLQEQSGNTWAGTASTGLVMMAGQVEKLQVGSQQVIRPYALYNLSNHMQDDLSALLDVNNKISQLVGGEQHSIRQLYLMETRLNNSQAWLGQDYLILDADSMSNFGTAFELSDLNVQRLVEANVRTENWEGQDENLKQLFISSFTFAYFKQQDPTTTLNSYFMTLGDTIRNQQQKEIFIQLLNFLNTQSWQNTLHFYQSWQKQMQDPSKMEWTALKSLLDSKAKE